LDAATDSDQGAPPSGVVTLAGVRFQRAGKVYFFDASDHPDLEVGDMALVDTTRGRQLGEVAVLRPVGEGEETSGLSPVWRRATGRDLALRQHWEAKESEALDMARRAAHEARLPIKLIRAEYSFDGQRLTLLYVGEDKNLRVDPLLKRLRDRIPARIDLRRVGSRDHAKACGGYGACGEPRCCARFLADFARVSIKMAKVQGISLSPSEITGVCGRLRCCLAFENEAYEEASRSMPRRKKRVRTPAGEGRVVDLLPLKGVVIVQVGDDRIEVDVEDVEPITS
jgi:cell fate regulator YaaT (PSP1 superfamily)